MIKKLTALLYRERLFIYVMVMGIGWVVDNVSFFLCTYLFNIPLSILIGRIAGALSGFLLHNKYSFSRQKNTKINIRKSISYVLTWLLGYAVMVFGVEYLVDSWYVHPWLAKVLLEFIIIPSNYLLFKKFVYIH